MKAKRGGRSTQLPYEEHNDAGKGLADGTGLL